MKHRKWTALFLLVLSLCVLSGTSCAEKMTLAFGYEIDIPEGVEITEEAWTPDDRALMYLLTGTYNHGEEKFRLRINYGFEHQLKTGQEYAVSNNVSNGDIWLWLETTTEIQKYVDATALSMGREVKGQKTEQYSWMIHQLLSIVEQYVSLSAKTLIDKPNTTKETENSSCRLDFGYELILPENATITSQLWTPEDQNGILFKLSGYVSDKKNSFYCWIYSLDEAGKNEKKSNREIEKGLCPPINVRHTQVPLGATLSLSWIPTDEALMSSIGLVFDLLSDSAEYLLADRNETQALAGDDVEENLKQLPITSSLFDIYYDEHTVSGGVTVPVAGGRYNIDMDASFDFDLPYEVKSITEGSVLGTLFEYTRDDGGKMNSFTGYQYYPLPDDFPKDIEYLPDDQYLEMIERALDALGEEKAILLRDLLVKNFNLKQPELITNEILREHHLELQQQIQNADLGAWHLSGYQEKVDQQDKALNLCRYWEIFDEPEQTPTDYLINGLRWLRVEGALIGGDQGGVCHCAIFDGALHYARGAVNLASLTRVEDWVETPENTEKDAAEPKETVLVTEAAQQDMTGTTAVTKTVNTKSSPLTLRETPGNNGQKILSIQKGETVTILKDGDWPLVEYNGHKGYVNGKYLK